MAARTDGSATFLFVGSTRVIATDVPFLIDGIEKRKVLLNFCEIVVEALVNVFLIVLAEPETTITNAFTAADGDGDADGVGADGVGEADVVGFGVGDADGVGVALAEGVGEGEEVIADARTVTT